MASAKQEHYKKLKKKVNVSTQLMFPSDLITDKSNIPHVVVFEPAIIKGHQVNDNINYVKDDKPTVNGSYGSEVAMNTVRTGSIRQENGFTESGNLNSLYKKTEERIILPMPSSININYNINWETENLGMIGGALNAINSAKDLHIHTLRGQIVESLKRNLAGAVQTVTNKVGVGVKAKDYYELSTGTTINAYSEVLFKNVSQRRIPFSYTFYPKSKKEAEDVRSIIHSFKYHAAPEFLLNDDNNSFIVAPSVFDISFVDLSASETGTNNNFLPRIATSALIDIRTNYTPENVYSVLVNGATTGITLELTFVELVTLGKDAMKTPEDTF